MATTDTISAAFKTRRRLALANAALLAFLGLIGCNRINGPAQPSAPQAIVTPDAASFPPLGPAQLVEPGVILKETFIGPNKIWVYLPMREAAAGTLPCVLIAPAGTPLYFGMDLQKSDRREHTPYVREGFAVVAYSISGPVADWKSQTQVLAGAQAYKDAQAGFKDAEQALAFALSRVPAIDPKRIYVAGHSSAATLSLLVAENEPRVAGCIAYAPCTDVRRHLTSLTIWRMDSQIPGFGAFIDQTSPINGTSRLRCPLFLFQAQDDTVESIADSAMFAAEVEKTNPNVNFVQPPMGAYAKASRGGHYTSMIQEGIPKAIQWLKALPGS